jgi:hypothetical protein
MLILTYIKHILTEFDNSSYAIHTHIYVVYFTTLIQ